MKKKRKSLRRRKNYYPTLILIVFFWGLATALVYFVDPLTTGAIQLFFVIIFLATLLTLSILVANSTRGLIGSCVITIFLILRYFGVGNIINILLLAGIAIAADLYFTRH